MLEIGSAVKVIKNDLRTENNSGAVIGALGYIESLNEDTVTVRIISGCSAEDICVCKMPLDYVEEQRLPELLEAVSLNKKLHQQKRDFDALLTERLKAHVEKIGLKYGVDASLVQKIAEAFEEFYKPENYGGLIDQVYR